MLRQSSSKKGSHVVWDEENLKSNLEIQKEYTAVKIAEPKTPYRPPLLDAELDEEMRPLELDEKAAEQAQTAVMTAFDYVMRNGGADFTPPGPSHRRLQTASSADAEAAAAAAPAGQSTPADVADAADGAAGDGTVGDKRTEPCASWNSSGSEGPGSADKKRRFEAMRKQHYNMKQALQQAKQLLSEEEEEVQDEEELEGDEDDTAGWKAANGNAAAQGGSSHEQQQELQGDVDASKSGQQQCERTAEQQRQQQDGTDVQDMEQTG